MWVRFLCIVHFQQSKFSLNVRDPHLTTDAPAWDGDWHECTVYHGLPGRVVLVRGKLTTTRIHHSLKKKKKKKKTCTAVSHRVGLLCWSPCWCCRLVSIDEPWCTAFNQSWVRVGGSEKERKFTSPWWERQDWEKSRTKEMKRSGKAREVPTRHYPGSYHDTAENGIIIMHSIDRSRVHVMCLCGLWLSVSRSVVYFWQEWQACEPALRMWAWLR